MSITIHGRFSGIAASVLLAASAAAGVGANGEARSGSGEPRLAYKLSFSIQTGKVESNQLTIDQQGLVTASIVHSVPGSPVRAIGRYSLAAGPSDPDLVGIGKLIADNDLGGRRPYTTSQQPGGLYVLFVIEVDGKKTEHVADTAAALPDSLGALAVDLTALMARVGLKAPQRAVSIQPQFDPAAAAGGDRLRITLDLRNAGPLRTEIRNFAGFRQGGADSLKIDFWKPPAKAGEPRVLAWTVDLTGEKWRVAEQKPIRPTDPYLKLEGTGSLRAWTEIRLPEADPGPLLAELVYYAHTASEAEHRNDDLVVGLYRTDPVNLTISPQLKR